MFSNVFAKTGSSVATLVSVSQKPSDESKRVSLNLKMKFGISHKWVPLQCLPIAKTGPSVGQPHSKTWKCRGIQGGNKNFTVEDQCYKSALLRVTLLTLTTFFLFFPIIIWGN